MDPKYKNGKIYEITSNNNNMIYVGSCTISLKHRLIDHKRQKCSSKYILECGDYNINLIQEYSCNNNKELRIREQYWIDKYRKEGKNVVNEQNAYTSKLQRQEKQNEYQKNNRSKYREKDKKYYEKNQEYYKEYRANNRETRKEYDKERWLFKKQDVVNGCYDFLEMLNHY